MTNDTYYFPRYSCRYEAIQREIVEPIKDKITPDARAEFDINAIADEVLGGRNQGYTVQVDYGRFWEIVAAHRIVNGGHRIIWDDPTEDGKHTARLMQWNDDEEDYIEIDSTTIKLTEADAPYNRAVARLASRNGLDRDDVTIVWF